MPRSFALRLAIIATSLLLVGCDPAPAPPASPTAAPTLSPASSPAPVAPDQSPALSQIGPAPGRAPGRACGSPTDHVYHVYRLHLLDPCKTVSGTIVAIRSEADGDYHVLLALDQQYSSLLRSANYSGQHGEMVLEPICQHPITQADAVAPCQGPVPNVPIPPVGTHVSATGSYVYDLDHGGWAELHPLFEIHPG